jgi:hypothetical protein
MTTDNELRLAGDHDGRKHAATQWDWRKVDGRNYITPSQDQGACQASTAFAITDAMNAKLRILFRIGVGDAKQILVPDLSAADVFYCGGGSRSEGQDVEQALNYATQKGVVPAYNIPYKPTGQTCGRGPSELEMRVTKISGFSTLRRQGAMQDAIQSRGPVIASLRAYQDLKNYRGGVYRYDGKSPFLYVSGTPEAAHKGPLRILYRDNSGTPSSTCPPTRRRRLNRCVSTALPRAAIRHSPAAPARSHRKSTSSGPTSWATSRTPSGTRAGRRCSGSRARKA